MTAIGYRAEIDAGRRFLEVIQPGETVVLLFSGDADGCCAGAIMYRALRQMGNELVFPVFMGKDESIYADTVAQRVLDRNPSYLIALDTGSRNREVVPGVKTMVVDHHRPEGIPPVDAFVTSHGVRPPAPASLLAYELCKDLAPLGGLDWLAAVGTAAEIGTEVNLDLVRDARERYGINVLKETITLINSARRAASHDIAVAFEALIEAESPLDIAGHAIPEAIVLESYHQEVNAELRRVLHIVPKIVGEWALIPFRSSDLIHGLVAAAWSRRIADAVVIAANYGYTEANVHFSIRSQKEIDLLGELSRFCLTLEGDYTQLHPKATGGYLPIHGFQALLRGLSFPDEVANSEP